MARAFHRIQVSKPVLAGKEKDYVWECLEREEITWHGRFVGLLEQRFADFVQTKHCAVTSSGTAALHLALLASGVGPGWSVVVPALTYVATANAVIYCGATPIFCDVQRDTWNMNPERVDQLLSDLPRRTHKALVPVHLYGVPAEMDLQDIAERHGATIIEDAAQAHGASYHGMACGSFGTAAAFSFYANKVLTTGEGGAVTTNNAGIDTLVRLLRGHGATGGSYNHRILGYNYRMTNLQAALGVAQLECVQYHLLARQRCAQWYESALGGMYELQKTPLNCVPAYWMVSVLVPGNRDAVCEELIRRGIETRPLFTPLTQLPMYYAETPAVAAEVAARGINLPTHGDLQQEDIHYVAEELNKAVGALC